MKKKWWIWLFLLILIVSVSFFTEKPEQANTDQVVAAPSQQKDLAEGTKASVEGGYPKAPDFTLKTLSGKELSLSDFQGSFVLVNMWASWCGPCQKEAPLLVKIDKSLSNEKLQILGVNMTSQELSIKNVRTFVSKYGFSFPILLDKAGEVMNEYGVIGIPTSYLLDPEGRLVQKFRGGITLEGIKAAITKASDTKEG